MTLEMTLRMSKFSSSETADFSPSEIEGSKILISLF